MGHFPVTPGVVGLTCSDVPREPGDQVPVWSGDLGPIIVVSRTQVCGAIMRGAGQQTQTRGVSRRPLTLYTGPVWCQSRSGAPSAHNSDAVT